jgi:Tfp pilus assembly protein PilV
MSYAQTEDTGCMRRPRSGMSLLEVVIAIILLGGVLLALGAFTSAVAHTAGEARLTATAAQLVADRLETVKGGPRYSAIESLYVKTETSLPGFKDYVRRTSVRRVGGAVTDSIDYKIVTVDVSHPALDRTVRKSTVMAPFEE